MRELDFQLADNFEELGIASSIFNSEYPGSGYTRAIDDKMLEIAITDDEKIEAARNLFRYDKKKAERIHCDIIMRCVEVEHNYDQTICFAIRSLVSGINPYVGRMFLKSYWESFQSPECLIKLGSCASEYDPALARKIFQKAESLSDSAEHIAKLVFVIKKKLDDIEWVKRLLQKYETQVSISYALMRKNLFGKDAFAEKLLSKVSKSELLKLPKWQTWE